MRDKISARARLSVATVLLCLLTSPGVAHAGYEFPVCTEDEVQCLPDISGDLVVWEDGRGETDLDIYGQRLAGADFPICTDPGSQVTPAVSGNTAVWLGYFQSPQGSWCMGEVYGCDLSIGAVFPISTGPWGKTDLDISGGIVVWADYRDDPSGPTSFSEGDIYGYDLGTGTEFAICTAPGDQEHPAVSGNTVVWQDQRNGMWDIYGYHLGTHQEFPVCVAEAGQLSPDIDGDIVVWSDGRIRRLTGLDMEICARNLATGEEFYVCPAPGDQYQPAISGNIIVWEEWGEGRGGEEGYLDIWGCDLARGAEFPVCIVEHDQWLPKVSGNAVVWEDHRGYRDPFPNSTRDIYGYMIGGESAHDVSVTVSAGNVLILDQQFLVDLTATGQDELGHTMALWDWTDGGAGGLFSYAASAPNPSYIGSVAALQQGITFTVTGRCGGTPAGFARASITLRGDASSHVVTVTAFADPLTVPSGGQTQLTALASDSLGHGFTWEWTDHGAGGTFAPSAHVQNPTWTAPGNATALPIPRWLTVTVTCVGSPAESASANVMVIEEPMGGGANHPPDVPINLQPSNQSTCVSITPTLIASPFSDPNAGDWQAASQWQISTRPDSFAGGDLVWDSGVDAVNLTQVSVPSDVLHPAARYWWRVQYQDNHGAWSGFSTPTWFTTDSLAAFSDAPCDHWAYPEIEACYRSGIVGGYPDGTYHPDEVVNRAQMAVFIARGLAGGDELVPSGPATAAFSDVPSSHWAYKYIEYTVDQGVVGGYWDNTYRPELALNRGAMAVFVARAMVAPDGDTAIPEGPAEATFSDVPDANPGPAHWAYKWIEYCHDQGVVGGYWDGTYRPDEVVNRGAMAVYVQRAFALPM